MFVLVIVISVLEIKERTLKGQGQATSFIEGDEYCFIVIPLMFHHTTIAYSNRLLPYYQNTIMQISLLKILRCFIRYPILHREVQRSCTNRETISCASEISRCFVFMNIHPLPEQRFFSLFFVQMFQKLSRIEFEENVTLTWNLVCTLSR